MVNSRRGRPVGPATGRARVLSVVTARIRAGELTEWSNRRIAAEAGVSHSLVNYYFGSRSGMLIAAYALTIAPHEVIAACRDSAGRLVPARLIRELVAVWEHPEHRRVLADFARHAIGGPDRAVLVDYLQHALLDALVTDLGISAGRRLGITIVGTIMTRYLLELPTVTALSPRELVALMRSTAGC